MPGLPLSLSRWSTRLLSDLPAPSISSRRRFRILALDVDGTLLDRSGTLRPSTVAAVARAARAGIRPVLCTGRRYRRAIPIAEQLGINAPLVCNSGALVKEPAGHHTLWRADFELELLTEILLLFETHEEPAVSFGDLGPDRPDFVVAAFPTGRFHFDEYVTLNQAHASIEPTWMEAETLARSLHFHLCAVGARQAMLNFEAVIRRALPGRVRTFVQKSPRYQGTMCEVIRPDASKWAAVRHVAEIWGVDSAEICAVGDDMNDVPMIEGAGLGVAMGHAPEAVRAVADLVTDDHDNDGVARLVDDVLLA